jgi:threonine dehydratase
MEPPTITDVYAARQRIAPYLPRTPLFAYPQLSDLVGADIWVKHENHQPVGAFKVRGGVNLAAQMTTVERNRGLIAASTGNHGQSVAYAAHLFGVSATICVPEKANPLKLAPIRSFGAQVIEWGVDFDSAREHCEQLAATHGYRYVHTANEPALIAGVGTLTLEIIEDQPELDVLIVPVGGGSAAAAACIVAKAVAPRLRVIGVQSAGAPAAYRSWAAKELRPDRTDTFAEGLATRVPFELPQSILWHYLTEFILVDDNEIRSAMLTFFDSTRSLVEAAGAAPLAAAIKIRDRLAGQRVALVASGGNISREQLATLLNAGGPGGEG